MRRRAFVTSVLAAGMATPVIGDTSGKDASDHAHGGHQNNGDHDRRENHAVDFGNWNPSVGDPIDRMTGDPNPRTRNGHVLVPNPVRVHRGDTVSFAISGFHNLLIYGPGTQPENIDRTKLLLAAGFPPLINDPSHRVYRGNDPRANPAAQDRVEVVAFNDVGRFLVMCGVLPHFFNAATGEFVMFGYVDVNGD